MAITIMVGDILTAGLFNGFGDESDCVKAYIVLSVDEENNKITYTENLKLKTSVLNNDICHANLHKVKEGIASGIIGHCREIYYDDDNEPHIAL